MFCRNFCGAEKYKLKILYLHGFISLWHFIAWKFKAKQYFLNNRIFESLISFIFDFWMTCTNCREHLMEWCYNINITFLFYIVNSIDTWKPIFIVFSSCKLKGKQTKGSSMDRYIFVLSVFNVHKHVLWGNCNCNCKFEMSFSVHSTTLLLLFILLHCCFFGLLVLVCYMVSNIYGH